MILLAGILSDCPQAQEISDTRSPRLRALAAQLDGGNGKALEEFWKETENVLLVGGLTRGDPFENLLEQLFGTDLWFKTYWTRNGELPCNDKFVAFHAEELVLWVRENYNVSTDPSENVIAGSNFGGLAASFTALRHPELFGNVISQSGSYSWSPETNSSFLAHEVEGEWLTRQYAEADTEPIRFFIEIGLNENGRPSMVIVNRHFRDVLLARGYEIVRYNEFNGGHEYLNWRGSLADGLIALIGK